MGSGSPQSLPASCPQPQCKPRETNQKERRCCKTCATYWEDGLGSSLKRRIRSRIRITRPISHPNDASDLASDLVPDLARLSACGRECFITDQSSHASPWKNWAFAQRPTNGRGDGSTISHTLGRERRWLRRVGRSGGKCRAWPSAAAIAILSWRCRLRNDVGTGRTFKFEDPRGPTAPYARRAGSSR